MDRFGKFLLCWFVLETILYYWSGRFLVELEGISSFYLMGFVFVGVAPQHHGASRWSRDIIHGTTFAQGATDWILSCDTLLGLG